jgi:hypothetical protein
VTMHLYQPMLFVGIGGTGCQVGAELERRLREEICGPDGTDFTREHPQSDLSPYQLPSCLQFVYADMNQAELDRLPVAVVPSPEHVPAVQKTARYVRDLVPRYDSYPEVAASLRLSAGEVVSSWLPPSDGEPKVAPLHKGAGQLPTIGRAALFETFRNGLNPATQDLKIAAGNLANCGTALKQMGGGAPTSVDVFVALSVAGGTGTGIFYDYLHLIGKVFQEQQRLSMRIFPLVLMPSAFAEGMGGGRPARLNAGRALLDLFRLVDQQNGGDVDRVLGAQGSSSAAPTSSDEVDVRYPVDGRVRLRPSTVPTAFLFSLPAGAQRDDLHRSMVSLVLSLIGSEAGQEQRQYQSFADSFINADVARQSSARDGIGGQGVSTALVASLTVPDEELADLVAGRMLRIAVERMCALTSPAERNREHIKTFFSVSGLAELLQFPQERFEEPDSVVGSKEIGRALTDRVEEMQKSLEVLDRNLGPRVEDLVSGFEPRPAVETLLGQVDPFHALRACTGDSRLQNSKERVGVEGLLQDRRSDPSTGQGRSTRPPQPELPPRRALTRLRWTDPAPVRVRREQDRWYLAQTQDRWGRHWHRHKPRWQQALRQSLDPLRKITDALREHARSDADRFAARAKDLSTPRVGVSYLLPSGAGGLDGFYERVRQQMIDTRAAEGKLRPADTETELVQTIIDAAGWRQAYRDVAALGPDLVVAHLREKIKTEVKQFFRDPPAGARPLIPQLDDRLSGAAGQARGRLEEEDLREFRGKLAGLLPSSFTPQGRGKLKILVTYPGTSDQHLHDFLKDAVHLPSELDSTVEFRTTTTQRISVVLFRSQMGVSEVREVREVLRNWAEARTRELPEDHLRWRQRTGFDFSYLATNRAHRTQILHQLLCALWNGNVIVNGDPDCPSEIAVELGEMRMLLPLHPVDRSSSWATVLHAYENWVLDDDSDFRGQFCAQLMLQTPRGIDSRPSQPSDALLHLLKIATEQPRLLEQLIQEVPPGARPRLERALDFWTVTFPSALDQTFRGRNITLRELLDMVNRPGRPHEANLCQTGQGLPQERL